MLIQLAFTFESRYQAYMAATSKRARKKHVQQLLFRRGGKRRGAGRKPKGERAGSPHDKRPDVKPYHPLHITLRIVPEVGSLRRRRMYKAIREATIIAAVRERIRIIHVSLQRTHVHLIVEAENASALARGMQGFQISVARNINTVLGNGTGRRRRGRVFADRYYAEVITSPRQARNTLGYVLLNWRKHGEDQAEPVREWKIDWFSTAAMFPDWAEYGAEEGFLWRGPPTYEPLQVFKASSWLLAEGWKKHGATISCHQVPSRS